jgi:broad specificity phosphatase PhoE
MGSRPTRVASSISLHSRNTDFGLCGRRWAARVAISRGSCSRRRWSSSSQPCSSRGSASDGASELRLPEIILARHGIPDWDFATPIPGHRLRQWLEGERDAGLVPGQRPGAALEDLIRKTQCLIASPLRRSIESARLLAPVVEPLVDEHFTEPALPSAIRSSLRLRPGLWTGLARSAWFCGWSAGTESFGTARRRAAGGAQILIARAERQGSVALVGHGLMNILIARQLRAAGWRGPRFPRPRHWAFGVYVSP